MELERRLSKAKSRLMLDHPFFGNLAMNMPFSLDNTIPTAATNGSRGSSSTLTLSHLWLMTSCCFSRHMRSCTQYWNTTIVETTVNHYKWNYAGDAVINPMLEDEGIGKFIEGGIMDRDLLKEGGGTTDGVYNLLPDDIEVGGADVGKPYDDCQDAEGKSPAEVSQQQAQMRVRVAQAAQAAKMMGKLSANMERFVGELLKPKVAWSDVMQRFLIKAKVDDRTFARANRRLIQQGLYLPTTSGEITRRGCVCY